MKIRDSLRPTTFEQYIGQREVKDLLRTSILAAQGRQEPLDNVLLHGPPGMGKTTLANIIASEMRWKLKTVIAPSLGGAQQTTELILGLKPRTMLFIDEVHRLRRPTQEILYPLLEDNKLFGWINTESELQIPPLTIIGATTVIGKLEQPFIDRFGLNLELEPYTEDDLYEIVENSAERLGIYLRGDSIISLVRRARSTPRIANHFLKRLRDYAQVEERYKNSADPITPPYVAYVLQEKLKIDEMGLNPTDRHYLRLLARSDAMGVEAIAAALHKEVETVEDYIEPHLVNIGFVERRKNGRLITESGRKWIRKQEVRMVG